VTLGAQCSVGGLLQSGPRPELESTSYRLISVIEHRGERAFLMVTMFVNRRDPRTVLFISDCTVKPVNWQNAFSNVKFICFL
jgi:hypothetical protein